MGCGFSKLRPKEERVPFWRWPGFLKCSRGVKVHPGLFTDEDDKSAMQDDLVEAMSVQGLNDRPTSPELAIIKDLHESGLLTIRSMTPMMSVTEHGRPMTPVTAAPGGCAFEVPLDEDTVTPVRKPPARLAKLAVIPKFRKKSKAEKKDAIMKKLQKVEARRAVLQEKLKQQGIELDSKIAMSKTVMASEEDMKKMKTGARVLAKAAMSASVKQQMLEERLEKIQAREEKREKVKQKKRSLHVRDLTKRIRRENRVAPLPVATTSRAATPAQTSESASTSRPMTPAEWDSITYSIPTRRC